jgi:hypothetical protein
VTEKLSPDTVALKFRELLAEKNDSGAPLYPRADVVDVLGLFFIAAKVDSSTLPEEYLKLLGEFALKIGYAAGDGSDTLQTKMETYFLECPPNPKLMSKLRTLLQGSATGDTVLRGMPESIRKGFIRG